MHLRRLLASCVIHLESKDLKIREANGVDSNSGPMARNTRDREKKKKSMFCTSNQSRKAEFFLSLSFCSI